jgi:hypothetical protein
MSELEWTLRLRNRLLVYLYVYLVYRYLKCSKSNDENEVVSWRSVFGGWKDLRDVSDIG